MDIKLKTAFTLVELLVVIAIVGILSGLIIVGMSSSVRQANIAKAQIFSSSLRDSLLINLVSEWKLDDGSGSTALDSWSNGNNGTLKENGYAGACDSTHCPQWQASGCVYGSCLLFDGTNDYVDCGAADNLKITGDITISAWVKPYVLTADNRVFANFSYLHNGYAMNIYANGRFYFGTWQEAAEQRTESSVGAVTINNWNYLVVTRSGTSAKTYRDGINVTSVLGSHINPVVPTVNAMIGYGGGAWPFNGLIDDVRVYNAVMPTSQIRNDYYVGINKLFTSREINKEDYSLRVSELLTRVAKN